VTEQYLEYVRLLEQLDPNAAGEFLVLAATLIELKSRALLPSPPLETDDDDDPQKVLVRQLLEYKRFKDAADSLRSAADERAKRYVRWPAELPADLQGVELEEVQAWDLLSAFGKVMSAIGRGPAVEDIRYDETPIEAHINVILDRLARESPTTFYALFGRSSDRAEIIGLFLALLELIRTERVRAEQDTAFGTIYVFLLESVADGSPPLIVMPGEADTDAEEQSETQDG